MKNPKNDNVRTLNVYESDCTKWCNDHGIGKLSQETMKHCFMIPHEGVRVKHLHFESVCYPALSESRLDHFTIDMLGRYCTNNGKVVFVYRDGHTYVANGYWILDELRATGYRLSGLFVPFSNGEQIVDPSLATQWERASKK